MPDKKTLTTILLTAFALIFAYKVFDQVLFALSDQGGVAREYADRSKRDLEEFKKSLAESRATTESLSEDTSTSIVKSNEASSFRFPQSSCGDKPTGDNDTWYPVFIDGADLEDIRANYCADAVATKRKDTGVDTVQLASLTNQERAFQLAQAVNGDVGEPTITQVHSNDEFSQQPSVEVNPTEQTILESQSQQQQVQQKIVQATNLCYSQYNASQEGRTKIASAQSGVGENFVSDYINDIADIMNDMGETGLQECLAKAQQQR